jgi:hypothetical protein
MLSISGDTYAEVFAALADHPEFDAEERAAARVIAEDLTARDEWKALRDAGEDPDFEATSPRPAARHDVAAPIADARNFRVHGTGVTFHVRPYTTSNTMNVGVIRGGAGAGEAE